MVRIISTRFLDKSDPTLYAEVFEFSPESITILEQFDKETKMARKQEQARNKQTLLLMKSIPQEATTAHPSSLPGNTWAYKRAGNRKSGHTYCYYISHGQLYWVKTTK